MPTNSLMGHGTALAEIPIGPEILDETAQITIVRTIEHNGHLALLIYAEGQTPVDAEIVFPGLILPASPPFGGRLRMGVPLIPSLAEGPNVAIVQFQSTLGPLHLHYTERAHGRTVRYEPKAIPLPDHCPQGGFAFVAKFRFMDGSNAIARTAVPCPPPCTCNARSVSREPGIVDRRMYLSNPQVVVLETLAPRFIR